MCHAKPRGLVEVVVKVVAKVAVKVAEVAQTRRELLPVGVRQAGDIGHVYIQSATRVEACIVFCVGAVGAVGAVDAVCVRV